MNSMIQTVDLTKKFNDFVANDHINLDVKEQEIKCIVGENGAGKSTMMNMLYGLLQPTSGKILIRGKEVTLNSPVDAIANGIGMVHQHFKLVPSLTVYENILLGAEITQKKGGMKTPFIDQKEEIKRVEKLIQENHLELNATDKIEDISVGGRQRVEILKMLYRNVDILILDEPTAVLTPQEVDELIATLKNLKEQGKTIIVITHKLREVMELADSITVIKQGKVVGNVLKKDTSERELAQMMVGRDVVLTVNNARKQQVESEIMYKAENLTTVNDYGKEVVSDMSFEVHKGEILGIAGVEGNGQSELVKLMTGLMESTRGTVFFDGKDITNWWPEKLRKAGIGIIPEDRYAQGLCREMTVSDNCIAGYHGEKDVCKRGLFNKKIINAKRDNGLNCTMDGFYSCMHDSKFSLECGRDMSKTFEEVKKLGVTGIDMESSCILTLGRLMGVKTCILTVVTVLENLKETLKGQDRVDAEDLLCRTALEGIYNYHIKREDGKNE